MKKPNDTEKLLDKFAAGAEVGRLRAEWFDALDEEPWCRFQDYAESLTEVAEQVAEARDALEQWQFAEDREEKAEARDRACEALDSLVAVFNASPLDLANMADWVPEDS